MNVVAVQRTVAEPASAEPIAEIAQSFFAQAETGHPPEWLHLAVQ
jgi:hypothetical protein